MKALERILGRFQTRSNSRLDEASQDEVRAAVRALVGKRYCRRKGERVRTHVTYRQRDQIAWLLIRLNQRGQKPMKRSDWIGLFVAQMTNLTDFTDEDISQAAEDAANDQEAASATDDANLWQSPGAAAMQVINEWQDAAAQIEDLEANGLPVDPNMPRRARRQVRYPRTQETESQAEPGGNAYWLPPDKREGEQ